MLLLTLPQLAWGAQQKQQWQRLLRILLVMVLQLPPDQLQLQMPLQMPHCVVMGIMMQQLVHIKLSPGAGEAAVGCR
jgi:hypothetical protein